MDHTDDIISLTLNESPSFSNIVATGQIGKSPVIYVWDATTLSVSPTVAKDSPSINPKEIFLRSTPASACQIDSGTLAM